MQPTRTLNTTVSLRERWGWRRKSCDAYARKQIRRITPATARRESRGSSIVAGGGVEAEGAEEIVADGELGPGKGKGKGKYTGH